MGRGRKSQDTPGCEVCGKSQSYYLEIHLGGEKHIFDSFECAMSGLMRKCPLCGCLLLGPGVQVSHELYCCHACASLSGAVEVEIQTGTNEHR